MSLRNLLGLGRKLIQKKADDTVPEAIETTTIGGLPDLAKLKTPTPNIPSVTSQSKALVAKEMTVPIEELFDANIAQFNKAGDLTGGILFAAKESGVKIPGRVLSDMIQDSPINRIKIRELGIPQSVINKAENTVNTQIARLADMERSLQRTVNVNPAATRVEKVLSKARGEL